MTTSERPLATVIIPVFNGEPFLAAAIESCLAHDYHPVEVIVVELYRRFHGNNLTYQTALIRAEMLSAARQIINARRQGAGKP